MDIKVLYTRGDRCYIVQKGNLFYLVDLDCEYEPIAKKNPESFLKFGYFFPVNEIDENDMLTIKSKLLKICYNLKRLECDKNV